MLAAHPKPTTCKHNTHQSPVGKGGWQQSNTQPLIVGQCPHLTEKTKGNDLARAPRLEELEPRPEPPPLLHCHCYLESGTAIPGEWGREGDCGLHTVGEAPPQMPSSPAGSAEAEAATLSKEGGWPQHRFGGPTHSHSLTLCRPFPASGKVAHAWL